MVIEGIGDIESKQRVQDSWRSRLYERLWSRPYPLLAVSGTVVPAAAIWSGSRLWTSAFRAAEFRPGDRLALVLPPGAAFVQILVAAIWEGLTIAPFPASTDPAAAGEAVDARAVICLTSNTEHASEPSFWTASEFEGPLGTPPLLTPKHPPTPEVRFLLRTSGTTLKNGESGRWVALGDHGVLAVLDSHLPRLDLAEESSRVLSALPWHHAFGLVLDLLPALLTGAEIARDPYDGRNLPALLDLAESLEATHFCAVPLTIRRLAETERGRRFLQRLEGGIVGGAPVDAALARFLSTTRLRVGYGQTEASPGIALGDPGIWPGAGYLGTTLGCDTRVEPVRGELEFRGANACIGAWDSTDGFLPLPEGRWAATGDLVHQDASTGGLFYLGRTDDAFKLTNGRRIEAGPMETALKAAHSLEEALLHSPDGETLEIILTPGANVAAPSREAVGAALGTLGKLLTAVRVVPPAFWSYTRKGALDRRVGGSVPGAPEVSLSVGPDVSLTAAQVERTARELNPSVVLTPEATSGMLASVERLGRLRAAGTPIYGTTTGFGPHVRYASDAHGVSHGSALLAHLGAGFGPDAPAEVVRAAQIVRAQSLSQGYSGVRPELLQRYLSVLAAGITPCVPEIGSVGASGDLIPLGHIARAALLGEGHVRVHPDLERIPAEAALRTAGLPVESLEGRDALAFANGTSFLTAYAALATCRAERLLARAEALTGWLYRLLGARSSALDDRLHAARGHQGQRESARAILDEASRFGPAAHWEDTTRPLQEIYSIRCAPQILGACRENLVYARRLVETEINGVSDNPLLVEDAVADSGAAALHGGNFQGQQIAFAADALNAALVQIGVLAERQMDALVTPSPTNGNAPLLLAWSPGATSGLAGAQITATSLVAEMRAHCHQHGTFSIPTNGGNQDVVSMGTLAARMAYGQTERLAAILALLSMALVQLNFLREEGRADGTSTPPPPWMPPFAPLEGRDRALWEDTQRLANSFLHPTDS
ncbi:MAG: aromatic amino acid lyase [Cytophagales bacterium]|nr:aromatic amino acid lyase [Armatimonadota bacterium]